MSWAILGKKFIDYKKFIQIDWYSFKLDKLYNLYRPNVRQGSLGVVSFTCDPVLALGQRFYSQALRILCCNPLGKAINWTLHSLLGWDLKQEVLWLYTHYIAHMWNPISLFKKRVGPCDQWWWMTVHQHMKEGYSLKPTNICSHKNGLWWL